VTGANYLPNSAAQGNEANLVDTTEDFYDRHFDANVKGPVFLTKAVEPHLPKGGRIVFISSAGARLGVAGQTVYAATKAANEALARVWAKELGQSHGITVNSVNPGPIATDQWFQSDEQFLKDMQPLIDSTPAAARVGEVNDIAPLVAFLCSDDARWTTGATLSANGGLYN
jgi:3-oxoacyl-[acyl-carrier protein] reductase